MDSYQSFYENIITFDKFIEIRSFKMDGMIFSKYFDNYKDLYNFINYNKDKLNMYVGINPRFEKGRKNVSVSYLKNIIFDIESNFAKPKLFIDDKQTHFSEYGQKLLKTINWISNYLYDKHKLKINCVVTSGRGMHIYITLNENDITFNEYNQKYKMFYKNVCDYINKNNPYKGEIKVDSMCSDFVRILGTPGSINIKYPEKPIRKIIYFNLDTDNKIKKTLDIQKTYIVNKSILSKGKFKYNEETIFDSPEFKIFEYKPIEGTSINNKLRLALKLLMARDKLTNYDEVAQRIANLEYPYKEMSFAENEYPDYKYNEKILQNYVLDNFEWAQEVGFKIPYQLPEEKKIKKYYALCRENPQKIIYNDMQKINDFKELVFGINKFNKKIYRKIGGLLFFNTQTLKKYIYENITNEKFKKFIEQNELIERLKYFYK